MAQGWRALVADVRAGLYSSRVFCHKAERAGSLRFVPINLTLRTLIDGLSQARPCLGRSRNLLQQFACALADECNLVFSETITVQQSALNFSLMIVRSRFPFVPCSC